jgi:hypothetical protein
MARRKQGLIVRVGRLSSWEGEGGRCKEKSAALDC